MTEVVFNLITPSPPHSLSLSFSSAGLLTDFFQTSAENMRPLDLLVLCFVQCLFLAPCAARKGDAPNTYALKDASSLTIYYWLLDSPTPSKLAEISYLASADRAEVISYTPPSRSSVDSDRIRIGLYDLSTKAWRGIVTSRSAFSLKHLLLSLRYDPETKEIYHVGISQATAAQVLPGAKEDRLVVEMLRTKPGPEPILNRPVVLTPEGKVPEKEPEKTFFQK